VPAALSLETYVWQQKAAPKTLPKPLKTVVREMLDLADRITAVQVAVAALPHSSSRSSSSGGKESSAGGSSCKSPSADRGPEQQQQQHQRPEALSPELALEQSIQYVVTMLTQPLHESHQQQLQIVVALAAAVRTQLLEPSAAAEQQLRQLLQQLEGERERGQALVGTLRKQLHHDVMHVQQHDVIPSQPHPDQHFPPQPRQKPGGAQQHQQQQQQQPRSSTCSAEQLMSRVSAALVDDGVIACTETSNSSSNSHEMLGSSGGSGGCDVSVHVSRWWWVHAGEHYCQLLAFQYALDAVVAEVMCVANTTLCL